MTRRLTPRLAILAVGMAAAILYFARLDRVPPFLSTDETAFALQAHAIATTAHDTHGRLLPVYFQVFENVWFHPALVYALAPVLAVVRPYQWAVRLPVAVAALCNVLLAYALARRLGASRGGALGASVLLALTPAHFMLGRLACDYLLPVPFVLAWLVFLVDAHRTDSSWRFAAAGGALGLGLYTYIASLVTMPTCLVLTYAGLFASGARNMRPYVLVTAGFAAAALPLAIYLLAVPAVYAGFVGRYGGTTVDLDVLHRPLEVFSAHLIAERWPIYRSFFDWSFLFEHAETHVMSSTYTTGIFLKAMAVFIPIGIYHIVRNRRTPFTLLLLAAFFSAPFAASLIPEKHAIDRALVLVAMGAVIGGFGVDWLLMRRMSLVMWPARALCVGLFVWMAVQFDGFYREYHTAYAQRVGFWFDGNHAGAFEPLVRQHPRDDPRFIYLSKGLPRVADHWKLYLLREGRTDLLKRTIYFSQQDLQLWAVTPGSLLLTGADDPVERSFRTVQAVRRVADITEPDGAPSFTIFERTPWSGLYLFDGAYSAKVNVACTPAGASDRCDKLSTTAACPSLETITVASGLASDSCGYLGQALVGDDGSYAGLSKPHGIPVKGIFATTGTFDLSGSGRFRGGQYELKFSLTKIR